MTSPIDVDKEHVQRIIKMMAAGFISSVMSDMIMKNMDLTPLNKEKISKKPLRKIPVRVQKVVDAL